MARDKKVVKKISTSRKKNIFVRFYLKNEPDLGELGLIGTLGRKKNVKRPLVAQMDKMSVLHKDILMARPEPLSHRHRETLLKSFQTGRWVHLYIAEASVKSQTQPSVTLSLNKKVPRQEAGPVPAAHPRSISVCRDSLRQPGHHVRRAARRHHHQSSVPRSDGAGVHLRLRGRHILPGHGRGRR